MKITVRLFAILRERAGVSECVIEVNEASTVEHALVAVSDHIQQIAALLPRVAIAVNRNYAARNLVLHDGDEIALIPPVSGG